MRNCIAYLARSDQRTFNDLKQSLNLLRSNLEIASCVPIFIFVEQSFSDQWKASVQEVHPNVSFWVIELNRFTEATCQILNKPYQKQHQFGLGYRNMCHFFWIELLNYLDGFDFVLRLDTDSFITGKTAGDPFQSMADSGCSYGYIGELLDSSEVTQGMAFYFQNLAAQWKVKPVFMDMLLTEYGDYNQWSIYNNFELLDLRFFRSPRVRFFIAEVSSSGHIGSWRWGDSSLRVFLLSLFLSRNQICRFKSIDYQHAFFRQINGRQISSCPILRVPSELIHKHGHIGIVEV